MALDQVDSSIPYKGKEVYLPSPLNFLTKELEKELGDYYTLVGIVYDDTLTSANDTKILHNFTQDGVIQVNKFIPSKYRHLTHAVPSDYRALPQNSQEKIDAKKRFEENLMQVFDELQADVVLVDGLLVILDTSVRPTSRYYRKIINIHPGITREDSPYQRRGLYASSDALYAAQGKKIIDRQTMESMPITPIHTTGASLHYVNTEIDAGEVIHDVAKTHVEPNDTLIELRWKNFHQSLFPAVKEGLVLLFNNANRSLNSNESVSPQDR